MNIKKFAIITVTILFLPFLAGAQTGTNNGEPSILGNLLWTMLPIIIVLAAFFSLIRRMQTRVMKIQAQHRERQVQHMERVERLLERIAAAAEKKGTAIGQ